MRVYIHISPHRIPPSAPRGVWEFKLKVYSSDHPDREMKMLAPSDVFNLPYSEDGDLRIISFIAFACEQIRAQAGISSDDLANQACGLIEEFNDERCNVDSIFYEMWLSVGNPVVSPARPLLWPENYGMEQLAHRASVEFRRLSLTDVAHATQARCVEPTIRPKF